MEKGTVGDFHNLVLIILIILIRVKLCGELEDPGSLAGQ